MYHTDQFEKMFNIVPLSYVESARLLRNQPAASISIFKELADSLTKGTPVFDSQAKVLAIEDTVVVFQNLDSAHVVISMPIMEAIGSLVARYKPVHSAPY